ncbi:MAG: hypothetical protein ACKVVP_21275 [Chloroflexota bacterium]
MAQVIQSRRLRFQAFHSESSSGVTNHRHSSRPQPRRSDDGSPRPALRPENPLDWTAFTFLLVGAFAWGYYATQINLLTAVLGRIWEPRDERARVLIAASSAYWLCRVLPGRRYVTDGYDERRLR